MSNIINDEEGCLFFEKIVLFLFDSKKNQFTNNVLVIAEMKLMI